MPTLTPVRSYFLPFNLTDVKAVPGLSYCILASTFRFFALPPLNQFLSLKTGRDF